MYVDISIASIDHCEKVKELSPAPAQVPTLRPLVPSFTSVVG